jgi:hypothetical protein
MSLRILKISAVPCTHSVREGSYRRAPKRAALTLILLGGVWLLGTVTGLGKDKTPTTRTISGAVMDDAENPIEGATVELTDPQTSKVLDIYSQAGGQYQFTGLRFDHDYTVKAMFKGASSEVRRISMFETRWHLVLNLVIPKPKK